MVLGMSRRRTQSGRPPALFADDDPIDIDAIVPELVKSIDGSDEQETGAGSAPCLITNKQIPTKETQIEEKQH